MSVLLLAAVAIPGGVAALLTFGRPRTAVAIGLSTAILCVILAATITAGDAVLLAGTVVAGSDGLRGLAATWAAGIVLLGIIDVLVGTGGTVIAPLLLGLGAGVLGLSTADAGIGLALLTAGAIAAAIGPLLWLRTTIGDPALLGLRVLRPLAVAGLLGLLAVAWGASPVGPFAATDAPGAVDPGLDLGLGIGLLAMVAAVLIRLGAIPAHVWAARLAEGMPAAVIPGVLGWSAAGFALIALGWVDVTLAPVGAPLKAERSLVAIVAVTSILLGGLAAVLHDDLEHILGYSIVQDAGVALLSFSLLDASAVAAGRDWLVGMAAVKAALAAWMLVTRSTFGVRRRSEIRGWARASPLLGVTYALVLVGAIGLPGMAAFDARGSLVGRALDTPFDLIVLVAAFAPVIYLGRVLLAGLDRMAEPVREVVAARPAGGPLRGAGGFTGFRPGGWSRVSVLGAGRAVPHTVRANRLALAAAAALLLGAIGLAVATAGLDAVAADPPLGGEPPAGASP